MPLAAIKLPPQAYNTEVVRMDVAMGTFLYVRLFVRFSPVYLRIASISTNSAQLL